MMRNGNGSHARLGNSTLTYSQRTSKTKKRLAALLRSVQKLKDENEDLRAQNRRLQEQLAQLEVEKIQTQIEHRTSRKQPAKIAEKQTGFLFHPATDQQLAEIQIESSMFNGTDMHGRARTLWSFSLIRGKLRETWRKGHQIHLRINNGPAIRTRVAAIPSDGSKTGLLEFT